MYKNTNYKILIVEDAKLIAIHLQKILENAGYKVAGLASTKKEALALVEDKNPDLILMDVMLADGDDGIDTIIEIQAKQNIPVVYLTALTDRNTVERAKKTKPYGYIMKPFQTEQVITLLEMALHKYSAENKLNESEKKFRAAVFAISDVFIFLDEEFKIEYINMAAEEKLQISLAACKEKNFYDIVHFISMETGLRETNLWKGSPESKDLELEPMYLVQPSGNKLPIGDGRISKVYDHKEQLKGVVITFRDISDKLKENDRKEELNNRHLSGMIEGQENERERIARELHDGLGQVLNGIKLQLNNVSDTKSAIIDDLKALIDEAIHETSRISENLLPSKLKNFDLGTCLSSLIQHDFSGLKVSFQSNDIDNSRIDMKIKVNIYRVAQEIINNCIRHAQASCLSMQLHGEDTKIVFTVEDDGKGFDLTKEKEKLLQGHMGLQNIIDRVKILKGKIEIDSKLSKGTLVIIEIPYTDEL